MQGQQWIINHYITATMTASYDGDGLKVKEIATGNQNTTTYYLRSSVLEGQVLEEINSSGQKTVGYVYYPGGEQFARQSGAVNWIHQAPANTSRYETQSNNPAMTRTEFDPLGADVQLTGPPQSDVGGALGDIGTNHFAGTMDSRYSNLFDQQGCLVNGFSVSCGIAAAVMNFGTGASTSVVDNSGVTMHEIASSVLLSLGPEQVFFSVGTSIKHINVSGIEGIPGKETYEWQWINIPGYGPTFAPVPTAYSGTLATVLTPALSVLAPQSAPQARTFEQGALNRAKQMLTGDCALFIAQLLRRAAEVTRQLTSIMTPNGTVYNFDGDSGLLAYQGAINRGEVRSLKERRVANSGFRMPDGAEGVTTTSNERWSGWFLGRTVTWRESFYRLGIDDAARQTLHESAHQFDGFSDQILANAAQFVSNKRQVAYGEGSAATRRASTDLNLLIREHCR